MTKKVTKNNIRICAIVFLSFIFSCFFNLSGVYAEDTCGYVGKGCTTAYYIDHDCDGYGVASPRGPDADDNDASVNTAQSVIEKYGTLSNFLSTAKGYNPLHYYYVDVENGDDDTGAIDDETKPYKTWDAIHGKVKAGDIIIYRAGIHNIPITFMYPSISGTEENPIIVMAYPGELAIIDRLAASITIIDSDNLIFDGLTCRNSETGLGRGVMVSVATNIRMVNIDSGHSTSGLFAMQGLHNFHIENCVFHDTDSVGTHCVYIGARDLANSNITMKDNLMYNCGASAFQHNGRVINLLFENNVLHSSNMAAISLLMGVSDSVFRNNLGFNNNQGIIIYNYLSTAASSGILPYDQKNNLFVNNTFWTGTYRHESGDNNVVSPEYFPSVHFNDYILDKETREPQLELKRSFDNNVFRNNIFVTSAGPVFRFEQQDYLDTTVFENNLVYRYGDYRFDGIECVLNYGGGYYDNHDFEFFENFSELIKNNVFSWPEFKDVSIDYAATPGEFDFKLLANSIAIDFGVSTDAPNFDLRGNLRTGAPDAGCYEYLADTKPEPEPEPSATIYEDSEDGAISGWDIYDYPTGATIVNVYDDTKDSQAIQLDGNGVYSGFRLRNDDLSNWKNSTQFVIEWSMKYSENFTLYIDIHTAEGQKFVYYTPRNYNGLGTGKYIHHGLGRDVTDGQWHTFARDLQSDLEEAQPGVTILEVNGFLIRGSGKVDDIKLCGDLPNR